ncbi:MAG TPA: Xaa-Pro peptidase family protein [Stellaceae bacterium]|nr:Xaa-Pro peptidase family protein [Stellaceae bacterium]
MALHFPADEFLDRRRRTIAAMVAAKLDGLLIFRQESMYYLTGYDTFGYVYFQCLYLSADGKLTLLTRAPDRLQAQHTSDIADIRIWVDGPDAKPAEELRAILVEHGARGKRLGVEWESYGLTARNGQRLSAALDGFCALADASELVSRLRLIKSQAELAYARRAAELCDAALDEARRLAKPGAYEGDILAAMQGAVFRGGGDDPANEYIIGSGPDSLLCRYKSGRRHLGADDQLTLEFAGVYRHYHACLMRTLVLGRVDSRLKAMHEACVAALEASEAALKPGRPIGEAFDAHARVLDSRGHRAHRLNACGYSLGATFAPNWMDWPMLYHGNTMEAAPGMVFFLHMIVFDAERGLAMTLGRTSEITQSGAKPLSRAGFDFALG